VCVCVCVFVYLIMLHIYLNSVCWLGTPVLFETTRKKC